MNDDLRQKANEAYNRELSNLEGKEKPKSSTPLALSMPTLTGANLCDKAPQIIKTAIGLVDSFSWFIPDNIEKPLRAFLKVLADVIMPAFCNPAASAETVQKKG